MVIDTFNEPSKKIRLLRNWYKEKFIKIKGGTFKMENTLTLELEKEPQLGKQSTSIISNISEAFGEAIKKGTSQMNFPDNIGEAVKSGLEKIDLKDIGSAAVESALKTGMKNLGMKAGMFNNIKDIFEAIKEGGLKKGLSAGLNVVIGLLKIPTKAKTMIKNGKDLILDSCFEDELKAVMKKQQNTISRINKKCEQMENAFQKGDNKTLERISKTLKSDLEKVMPIAKVIQKGESILNQYELYKNKGKMALSAQEKELCQKLVIT